MLKSNPSVSDVKSEFKNLNIKGVVRTAGRHKAMNLVRISRILGTNRGFLSRALDTADIKISLVLALSINLQSNLLEIYSQFLPPELLETARERQLKKQITELQTKFDALQKERDLLKEIVMK